MSNTSLLGSYGAQDNSSLLFRNKVINGDMRIDQRNSGAAVSTSAVFTYPVDRFRIKNDLANGTTQRSTTAPTGFTNSLVFTTGTGAAASGACTVGQAVEGFNIADLAWGTAAAQAVTTSFWVRSSLTGTFAFRISNGARSYVATYTISSANTFEFKTIVIPGDTSGTWVTDNSAGMYLNWDLGSGSNFTAASAGSWLAGDSLRVSGTVNVVSTSGATFYITGVQLEAGPTATPFERRPYSVELGMCQRYGFEVIGASKGGNYSRLGHGGMVRSTTNSSIMIIPPVPLRTSPSSVAQSGAGGISVVYGGNAVIVNSLGFDGGASSSQCVVLNAGHNAGPAVGAYVFIECNNTQAVAFFINAEL